jgi:hypothetical protein
MTPVDVQLQSIARDAVKMFEGEARAAGVDLQFQVEDTCNQANVDNISLDPTRVLQILIVSTSSAVDEMKTKIVESHYKRNQIHAA